MPRKLSHEEAVHRIKTLHPALEILGHYVNQRTPIEVHCTMCGRTWKTLPLNLFRGRGCTCQAQGKNPGSATKAVIARRKEAKKRFPDIVIPDDLKTVHDKFDARCTVCGHVWTTTLRSLIATRGCPRCSRQPTSTAEMFLFEAVRLALYPERVLFRDRKAIGRELDVYVPGRAKAIECGSWHWHKRAPATDIAKEELCKEAGIELLTIYTQIEDNNDTLPKNVICLQGPMQTLPDLSAMATRALAFVAADGAERAQHLDWQRILETTRERTDRKAIVQRFANRMAKEHPDIEVLGRYVRSDKHIKVRCTVCGHIWASTPNNLLQGHGCPICGRKRSAMGNHEKGAAGLRAAAEAKSAAAKASFVMKMAEVNPNITIVGTYTKSNEKLECSCNVCGHHWMAMPSNLLRGAGCPECARMKHGASRKAKAKASFVAKMAEVNPNITIIGTYATSKDKLECSCNVCGHHWMATPNALLRGHGCPECARMKRGASRNAKAKASFVAKMAEVNPDITIVGPYTKFKKKLECSCNICGHHWMTAPKELLRGHGCPNCARKRSVAAMAATHAAKRAAKTAQNPNGSRQPEQGNAPDCPRGKETPCP